MKIKALTILAVSLTAIFSYSHAQLPATKPMVAYSVGISKGRVPLVNITGDTLKVKGVRTSTPCIEAVVEPVVTLPNDTAWIKFNYDPNRGGTEIDKIVTVSWEGGKEDTSINISGMIIPTGEQIMWRQFPVAISDSIRFDTNKVTLDLNVQTNRHVWPVKVYNGYLGRDVIVRVTDAPEWIHAKTLVEKVHPGSVGVITVEAFPEKAKKLQDSHDITGVVLDAESSEKITDFDIVLTVIPKEKKKKK